MDIECGSYVLGELMQCEACEENSTAPRVDPTDEDAQAELEAERNFTGRRP